MQFNIDTGPMWKVVIPFFAIAIVLVILYAMILKLRIIPKFLLNIIFMVALVCSVLYWAMNIFPTMFK